MQHDRRAIAIGDHDRSVVLAGDELIVGIDLVVLARAVEVALGGVDAGLGDGGAQILQIDAVGRERRRVGLNAHRGLLAAADADQADAAELRDLGREARVDQILDLRERHGVCEVMARVSTGASAGLVLL